MVGNSEVMMLAREPGMVVEMVVAGMFEHLPPLSYLEGPGTQTPE